MKISLNWLKKYVNVPAEVSNEELVRLIGARLVEVEGVIDETHKYDNIYVVRVETCEKIPDTHLTLCQINAGMAPFRGLSEVTTENEGASPVTTEQLSERKASSLAFPSQAARSPKTGASDPSRERSHPALVQVVCGAPNVHEGMLAVWIAPGATVPASVHEDAPFVIGKRKMQGYESCGMLAGADELDFGEDHSGIVEIDPGMAAPGDKLADVFELNDLILDIENKSLTHRPDCFGIIGFAREVAGILGEKFEYETSLEGGFSGTGRSRPSSRGSRPHTSAAASGLPRKTPFEPLSIKISDSSICSRYTAIVLEKHGEIKKKYLTWVDTVLSKSGMKPISPIVDATNYLMLLTGQPLHAFDFDKFVTVGGSEGPQITVRLARVGEELTLLDDKEVALNENDIVICSGDTPVALAGAMGGKNTEIDENTKNVIIESATFSLYNLRKTQMAHGIFSEAITRFTKGQPAYQTVNVAMECAEMLADGYKIAAMADEYPRPAKEPKIIVTIDEINTLLGTEYTKNAIVQTLTNVGFDVKVKRNELTVVAPEWRTDIHIKEDIIEEVGRLNGYDNIEPVLPLHGTPGKNKMWELKKQIRRTMARFGANELLTYSFVSGRLLDKVGQKRDNSYKIVNSISPELQYVRQSIVPSLLEKTYLNEKLPVEKFAIFEMNKVYRKEWCMDNEGVPVERMQLGCVVAERKNRETAFYKAKWYAAKLFESLNIAVEFLPMKEVTATGVMMEPKRAAEIWVNNKRIGAVGEFKNSVKHEFKLAEYLAGFEVNLDAVIDMADTVKKINPGIKKKEDVTVTTDRTYAEILKELQDKYPEATITPGVVYQAPGQKTRNITFHVEIA